MTRNNLLKSAQFYREDLRREAAAKAKRYPKVAEQLHRLDDGVDRQIEQLRCGPLFADKTGEAA